MKCGCKFLYDSNESKNKVRLFTSPKERFPTGPYACRMCDRVVR